MEFYDEMESYDEKKKPPPKKRIRRCETHKVRIAKEHVERGAARTTKSKTIAAKVFTAQTICKCFNEKKKTQSCSTRISVERQREIFEAYYNNMDWSQKTLFIRANVQRQPVKTKKTSSFPLIAIKGKEFNHIFSLTDEQGVQQKVCRTFFLNCVQVNPDRVCSAVASIESNPSASENRGKHAPANKTSEANKEAVRQFIDNILKFESHNRTEKNPDHTLSVVKLYNEYKNSRKSNYEEFVSECVFREMFNAEYNYLSDKVGRCKTLLCDPSTSAPSTIVGIDYEANNIPTINEEFTEFEHEMEFYNEMEFDDEKEKPSPRKRIRRCETHKATIAKEHVERGAARTTKTKTIAAKVFTAQTICKCFNEKKKTLSCSTRISVERQREIFEAYYNNMDWSQKTLFIRANVQRQPVKTKKTSSFPLTATKGKEFNHVYSLTDEQGVEQKVCRKFFLNCIQVNADRVCSALASLQSNPSASENRGKNASANKTSEANKEAVRQFIDSIPKYESQNAPKKYLHHTLSIIKLYNEYKSFRESKCEEVVSEYVFREMFNAEYNYLSFKCRHSDTCLICEEIKLGLNCSVALEETQLSHTKHRHMNLVEKTHPEFVCDVKNAQESDREIVILTFDLQKTLETPSLATSEAIYKRQLWTYNFCVYDEVEKRAFMYVWSENIASRGGQEIGSCLLKHLQQQITPKTRKIIMYSDVCGVQSRNIKLTMLLKKYLHDNALQSIEQKYFVSGHSYNSCDRSFSLIEKYRKSASDIYTPTHWANLIWESKKCEPKFNVIVMNAWDFVSSAELQEHIEGNAINWLQIRAMTYYKAKPFIVDILTIDGNRQMVNIMKKNRIGGGGFLMKCHLPKLFPNGRAITKAKYADLMDLLRFMPYEHHGFFKGLNCDDEVQDYGLDCNGNDE